MAQEVRSTSFQTNGKSMPRSTQRSTFSYQAAVPSVPGVMGPTSLGEHMQQGVSRFLHPSEAPKKRASPVGSLQATQIGLQACQASCQRGAASYPSLSQIRPAMSSRFEECRRPPDPKSSWPTEWSQAPMRRKILPVSAKMKTSPSVEELLDKFPESLFWAERSQSEIGSSTSLRVLSMSAGNAWSRSSFTCLSDEKAAQKRIAVDMLLEVIAFLESRKVDVGARHLVTSESELRELLIPRRPGTTIRVCRMSRRFQKFVEADPLSSMEIQPQLESMLV